MEFMPVLIFALYGGTFVIFVIAYSIPYWLVKPISGGTALLGLWQACSSAGAFTRCFSSTTYGQPVFFKAVQGMETLGLICAAVGLAMVFVGTFVLKEKTFLKRIGGVGGVLSGLFVIIGVIIFGAKKDRLMDETATLHVGFGLSIVSAIGFCGCGCAVRCT